MKKFYIFTFNKQLRNFSESRKDLGKLIIMSFLLVSILFVSNNQASAQCTVDGSFNDGGTYGNSSMGQSFKAECDGTLLQLKVLGTDGCSGITVAIYEGDGLAGNVLGSVSGVSLTGASSFSDYSVIDLSGESISVTNGNIYTFNLISSSSIGLWATNINHYVFGKGYWSGAVSDNDLHFKVEIAAGSSNTAPTASSFTPHPSMKVRPMYLQLQILAIRMVTVILWIMFE